MKIGRGRRVERESMRKKGEDKEKIEPRGRRERENGTEKKRKKK